MAYNQYNQLRFQLEIAALQRNTVFKFNINWILETKAIPLLRHCNTGTMVSHCPLPQEKNFPTCPIHVVQKITGLTCAENRKILGLKIWYSVLAPFGGAEKKLNMGAQQSSHPLQSLQNIFENCTAYFGEHKCWYCLPFLALPLLRTWQFWAENAPHR